MMQRSYGGIEEGEDMPRYWVMAPVESKPADLFGKVWQFDLAANVISIGWKELGDVSGLTRDALAEAVAKASLDKPSQIAVHECSSRLAAAFDRI